MKVLTRYRFGFIVWLEEVFQEPEIFSRYNNSFVANALAG